MAAEVIEAMGLEVHETTSGKLSSVEIKSHSGLENQLADTIGQALKDLVANKARMASIQMKMSPLFTKIAMERLLIGRRPQMRRKDRAEGKTADKELSSASGQPLEGVDKNVGTTTPLTYIVKVDSAATSDPSSYLPTASNASSRHEEQGQHTAPPLQDSHAPTNGSNAMPPGLFAPLASPTAEPVVIPAHDAATNEAVGQQSHEVPRAESSSSAASDQHVILEPTVYVPPSRPSVAAELEEAVVHSPPPEAAGDGSRSTSSSSSSSNSG
ncbi:hypothetical protein MKX08_008518 [Trichoderma sp. CBMAI-0020]|nr:hypothetical protein MKX08_008518 [Trichoderma sp. CBMAI-0020]WOD46288.1 hypothetical protein [Trichoderma atroviride]